MRGVWFGRQLHALFLGNGLDFGQRGAVIVDHFLGECFHFTGLGLVQGEPGGGNFVDIGLRHVLQCFLVAGAESGVRLSLARSLSLRGAGCLGLYANGAEHCCNC